MINNKGNLLYISPDTKPQNWKFPLKGTEAGLKRIDIGNPFNMGKYSTSIFHADENLEMVINAIRKSNEEFYLVPVVLKNFYKPEDFKSLNLYDHINKLKKHTVDYSKYKEFYKSNEKELASVFFNAQEETKNMMTLKPRKIIKSLDNSNKNLIIFLTQGLTVELPNYEGLIVLTVEESNKSFSKIYINTPKASVSIQGRISNFKADFIKCKSFSSEITYPGTDVEVSKLETDKITSRNELKIKELVVDKELNIAKPTFEISVTRTNIITVSKLKGDISKVKTNCLARLFINNKLIEGNWPGKIIICDSVSFTNIKTLKEVLEERDIKLFRTVNKKSNYVVNSNYKDMSANSKKARELGLPILDERQFFLNTFL